MIITTPVTDYIPASMLINNGDRVVRSTNVVNRLGCSAAGNILVSRGGDTNLGQFIIQGLLNQYLKGNGASVDPTYSKLALRDTGIKIGNSTRDTAGDHIIAGVGFESSVIIFIAIDTNTALFNMSWGFDEAVNHFGVSITRDHTVSKLSTLWTIYIERDVGNLIRGRVTTIGAEGFTINWALTGACACNFIYLCLP